VDLWDAQDITKDVMEDILTWLQNNSKNSVSTKKTVNHTEITMLNVQIHASQIQKFGKSMIMVMLVEDIMEALMNKL